MRNSVALLLGLSLFLIRPLAAQSIPPMHPTVPAAMDVAGLHLVLNAEAQRLVQQKADGLSRHQPSFQARVDLADASFPIVDRVLREEGVPLDFRYLALQESALIGDARSNHDAVGYWQLKQETATGLGLTVNGAVDERQHLAASTRAAARYLTRNNNALHNWLNALLSYYTGPSGVQPYTLPSDFDATEMAVTEATSPYVLMFLAHKVAFEPACGLNPTPPLRLQEFPATAGQSLDAQALALHVDPAALATHNHWLLAAAVPADRPYSLIVPVGDVTQAAGIAANQRLQSTGQLLNLPTVAGNTAEVRINKLRALIALPGESTADLARRAHQRLGEFLKHNELKAFDVAVTGRPYYLQSKRDAAAVEYHVLQPGESIFDVAQKYGVRQKAVFNKNRMARNEELRPGRVLWLQHTRPRETAVEYRSLNEAVALERPTAAPTAAEQETDALVSTANEAVALPRRVTTESGQVKVKVKVKSEDGKTKSKRVVTDDADGWGETLATAAATAATAPMPAPAPVPTAPAVVAAAPPTPVPPTSAPPRPLPPPVAPRPSAAKVTYLPPAAAAPAPAPLADEPGEPEAPSAPAPAPKPVLVKEETVKAPAPVASAPKPVAVVPEPGAAALVRPVSGSRTHVVAPHESVYSIARLYQMAPAALIAANQLPPPYGLTVGQVLALREAATEASPAPKPEPAAAAHPAARANPALYVPKAAAAAAAGPAAPGAILHTVAKGETLYSIARQYKVTVAELQAWNGKAPEDASAKIGEVLRVQAPAK
ncbi:LysM peptidoglycan-binding domain-containing protein [Hymenobacter convexus]|uniref:LysM peptidoglycan-binding domain-containing protein n=1 Tax=Hymenobacter sp. CA1UV-4 TaxID=3063782 RepID=UPI0027142787|nr:LysM peptidoglycan-binding domain-containing protein [Hymenobacter sp. CA1UV-4]MDO7852918.1 LysM peptidoglycan-binding domain-containing protein [Hymenobacter sp. CA1UV-4]